MKLKCVGKDRIEREFDLHIQASAGDYPRFVLTHPSILDGFFELILKPLSDRTHMVMAMNAHVTYGGYGIPDAIIPFAANYLSTEIRSSPTISACGSFWRTREATNAWERLVTAGKAEYIKGEDVYRVV